MIREMFRAFLKPQADIKQSVEGQRRLMHILAKILHLPKDVKESKVSASGVSSKWVYQSDSDDKKVIMFLHGGAYDSGSANTHRALAASISRFSKARVILPEYQLAPEFKFPSALEDSIAVYKWLIGEAINPSEIVIAGDSAGGGLAVATAFALRNNNLPLPAGIICLSPWSDLSRAGKSHIVNRHEDPMFTETDIREAALNYTEEKNLKDPFVSPVYGDFHNFPPLLLQVGDRELLLSDSTKLKERASSFGVDVTLEVWKGMWHDWHLMGNLMPESRKAIKSIGAFAKYCFEKTS